MYKVAQLGASTYLIQIECPNNRFGRYVLPSQSTRYWLVAEWSLECAECKRLLSWYDCWLEYSALTGYLVANWVLQVPSRGSQRDVTVIFEFSTRNHDNHQLFLIISFFFWLNMHEKTWKSNTLTKLVTEAHNIRIINITLVNGYFANTLHVTYKIE